MRIAVLCYLQILSILISLFTLGSPTPPDLSWTYVPTPGILGGPELQQRLDLAGSLDPPIPYSAYPGSRRFACSFGADTFTRDGIAVVFGGRSSRDSGETGGGLVCDSWIYEVNRRKWHLVGSECLGSQGSVPKIPFPSSREKCSFVLLDSSPVVAESLVEIRGRLTMGMGIGFANSSSGVKKIGLLNDVWDFAILVRQNVTDDGKRESVNFTFEWSERTPELSREVDSEACLDGCLAGELVPAARVNPGHFSLSVASQFDTYLTLGSTTIENLNYPVVWKFADELSQWVVVYDHRTFLGLPHNSTSVPLAWDSGGDFPALPFGDETYWSFSPTISKQWLSLYVLMSTYGSVYRFTPTSDQISDLTGFWERLTDPADPYGSRVSKPWMSDKVGARRFAASLAVPGGDVLLGTGAVIGGVGYDVNGSVIPRPLSDTWMVSGNALFWKWQSLTTDGAEMDPELSRFGRYELNGVENSFFPARYGASVARLVEMKVALLFFGGANLTSNATFSDVWILCEEPGAHGTNCQNWVCPDGRWTNDTLVCAGRGTCLRPDTDCICDDGWKGDTCSIFSDEGRTTFPFIGVVYFISDICSLGDISHIDYFPMGICLSYHRRPGMEEVFLLPFGMLHSTLSIDACVGSQLQIVEYWGARRRSVHTECAPDPPRFALTKYRTIEVGLCSFVRSWGVRFQCVDGSEDLDVLSDSRLGGQFGWFSDSGRTYNRQENRDHSTIAYSDLSACMELDPPFATYGRFSCHVGALSVRIYSDSVCTDPDSYLMTRSFLGNTSDACKNLNGPLPGDPRLPDVLFARRLFFPRDFDPTCGGSPSMIEFVPLDRCMPRIEDHRGSEIYVASSLSSLLKYEYSDDECRDQMVLHLISVGEPADFCLDIEGTTEYSYRWEWCDEADEVPDPDVVQLAQYRTCQDARKASTNASTDEDILRRTRFISGLNWCLDLSSRSQLLSLYGSCVSGKLQGDFCNGSRECEAPCEGIDLLPSCLETDSLTGELYTIAYSFKCWTPVCYGYSAHDDRVCTNRNGDCVTDDTCVCRPETASYGERCENMALSKSPPPYYVIAIVVSCLCVIVVVAAALGGVAYVVHRHKTRPDTGSILTLPLLFGEEVTDSPLSELQVDATLNMIPSADVTLRKHIASGGSGSTVYLAEWNSIDVVAKVFALSAGTTQDELNVITSEASLLSRLSHPNIVNVYGICWHAPRLSILIEWCEHGDIKEYLIKTSLKTTDRRLISAKEKLRWFCEISQGMQYLHHSPLGQILHRDLKCENVLLDEMLRVRITDFGLSRVFDLNCAVSTTKGIGTGLYMAPEMTRGEEYSSSIDVFAFGILAYVICTENFRPYSSICKEEGAEESIAEWNVAQDPSFRPPLDEIPEEMTALCPIISDLIASCWSADSDLRPTFSDVTQKLKIERV